MKKYTIIETRPALQVCTFEVEANSEEEALQMVENGEVDPEDCEVDSTYFGSSEYIVQDVEEVKNTSK